MRITHVPLCIAITFPACVACLEAAEEPFIVPRPKQMRLTSDRLPLVRAGKSVAVIVLADDASRQAEIGASEINQRVREVCGATLPVKRERDLAAIEPKGAAVILVGQPDENVQLAAACASAGVKVTASAPGPQGYAIRFATLGARPAVLLAGSDRIGMLYACVTLRFLVVKTDRGCDLTAADIRDWPDVRYRFTWTALRAWRRIATAWNGRYPPARPKEGVAAAKVGMDWILRHKINVVNFRHACEREKSEGLEAQFREVYRYAFERGIWSYTFGVHGNLGHVKEGEAAPEQKACFHYGRHGMLSCWCWSADRAMDRVFDASAQEIAASLPDPAPDTANMFITLHSPDTGNMGWHKRCDRCRKRFGNDAAAGLANVFNHFYRAVKHHIPGAKVVFVPRPYVGFNMDFEANKVYRDRLERLAKQLPSGSYLVHVAASSEAMTSWRRLTPNINLAHWVNGTAQWTDFLFRVNKTYIVDASGRVVTGDDVIFQGGAYEWYALQTLGAVQTMWDANTPGAVCLVEDKTKPFDLRVWYDTADTAQDMGKHKAAFSNLLVDGVPSKTWQWLPPEQKAGPKMWTWLQHAAVYVYGEQAGPLMLRVLTAGCLDRFLDNPMGYFGRHFGYGTQDLIGIVESMVRAYTDAAAAAEEIWAEDIPFKPGVYSGGVRVEGLPNPVHGFRPNVHYVMSWYPRLGQARVWLHVLAARLAVEQGDTEAANESIERAVRTYDEQVVMLKTVYERVEKRKHYRTEVTPARLEAALGLLATVKPKLETVRMEIQLKGQIRRFRPEPFKPHYGSGKMRVAVYLPNPKAGRVAGGQGILETLSADPEIEAAAVTNLSLGTLNRHDVLVLPSCSQMSPGQMKGIPYLRRYAASGGGVYVQHVSVGHPRFPLRTSPFPEVGRYVERVDSNRIKVLAKHPLASEHKPGEVLEHMYWDHMALDISGCGSKAVFTDADSGAPVVVVGQLGRGRVLLDGTIAYASSRTKAGKTLAAKLGKEGDFEHPAFGLSQELLLNGVRWLCGR